MLLVKNYYFLLPKLRGLMRNVENEVMVWRHMIGGLGGNQNIGRTSPKRRLEN